MTAERLVIVVQGGLVQGVYASVTGQLELYLVDWDNISSSYDPDTNTYTECASPVTPLPMEALPEEARMEVARCLVSCGADV